MLFVLRLGMLGMATRAGRRCCLNHLQVWRFWIVVQRKFIGGVCNLAARNNARIVTKVIACVFAQATLTVFLRVCKSAFLSLSLRLPLSVFTCLFRVSFSFGDVYSHVMRCIGVPGVFWIQQGGERFHDPGTSQFASNCLVGCQATLPRISEVDTVYAR